MKSKAIVSIMHSSYMIVAATYRCTRCVLSICPVQSSSGFTPKIKDLEVDI